MDIRKILIIFVVGILFSVLVFAFIGAVYPQPKWEDFCRQERFAPQKVGGVPTETKCPALEVSATEQKSCSERHGVIEYEYDSNGCAKSYTCSTCQYEFEQKMDTYYLYVFYISAALALIAIFLGLYLPASANTLNEWIGTGFMLGGAFALFFGTATSYTHLGRFVKPVVLILELALVIFMAYKKVGNLRRDKKK